MKEQRLFRSVSIVDLAVGTVLLLAIGYSYTTFDSNRQHFLDRALELERSKGRARQIIQLRELPDQAERASHSTRAIAKAIEQSASRANIAPQQIASIEPQAPSRKEDTAYLEHATVVKLDDVSLKSLATLTNEVVQANASIGQLHITSIRIDAPYRSASQDGTDELWNVEFILTYYVYSPKSGASRKS